MSHLTFAPAASAAFDRAATARIEHDSRLRGILSGVGFLGARVPVYAAIALLGLVMCVVGVALYAAQAVLGGRHA